MHTMFECIGRRLTHRIRVKTFSAMLKQDVAWFDRRENNTGALSARLAQDAGEVEGAAGPLLSVLVFVAINFVLGLLISLAVSVELGLLACLLLPINVALVRLRISNFTLADSTEKVSCQASAQLATEAINNIRTVAGLQCENFVVEKFKQVLNCE